NTSGFCQYCKTSLKVDTKVTEAYKASSGLKAFVVSNKLPPIPAAPRRIVLATVINLFDGVYNPDSSKNAAEIGCPKRDCAEAVTRSIRSISAFPEPPRIRM